MCKRATFPVLVTRCYTSFFAQPPCRPNTQLVMLQCCSPNSTEEGTWSALARQEVLYQEMGRAVDHDNAGAEEDLGQLVTGMDWLIAGL